VTYYDVARLLSEAVGRPMDEAIDQEEALKRYTGTGCVQARAPRPLSEFARDYGTIFR
jgi:hypothetical protein